MLKSHKIEKNKYSADFILVNNTASMLSATLESNQPPQMSKSKFNSLRGGWVNVEANPKSTIEFKYEEDLSESLTREEFAIDVAISQTPDYIYGIKFRPFLATPQLTLTVD